MRDERDLISQIPNELASSGLESFSSLILPCLGDDDYNSVNAK
jgi:hypothetical protein